ncbi:hypothetical protein GGR23_001104 [Gellertiella hungarica]|uniref:Uncharacterized protein n=1 Tax=Gellertiella hungarica TaxID=1572859 RepID=A0A7W6J3A6_9HYPH|nr:hypothetical protein [Gellertiella hungarica]
MPRQGQRGVRPRKLDAVRDRGKEPTGKISLFMIYFLFSYFMNS